MRKIDFGQIKRGLARRFSAIVPLRWTTVTKLAAREPASWTEIFPASTASWPDALPSGPIPPGFVDRIVREVGPKGVLRLRHAFVSTSNGWVFTRGGWRVLDLSHYGARVHVAPRARLPFPRFKARRLRGTTLSLLSTWGAYNYYHFLLESLPRLDLVQRAGLNWDEVDHILLPNFQSPTADRMVALLNLPEGKIIRVAKHDTFFVQADELICPSFPGERRVVAPWAVAFVYRTAKLGPTAGGRRLFVPRRARNRFLRNEAEIWRQLSALGFELIDPASENHVEAAFHAADAVVGVHGAALANLAFCRPGTRVLELVPSDQPLPYYLSLSSEAGLVYDCIVGKSEQDVPRDHQLEYNSPFDFEIPPEIFARQLAALLAH